MARDPDGPRLDVSGLAAWGAPAGLSIYVKMVVLVQVGVCFDCLALSGQSPGEKIAEISFFRSDLLAALLVVPATLLLVQWRLRPARGLLLTVVVSALTYAWLFAELRCLQSVGMFISPGLLRDAVVWGWENPGRTASYLQPTDQVWLAGGLTWIAVAWWWSARRLRQPGTRWVSSWTKRARAVSAFLLATALVVPWIPRVPVTPYHRSALSWAFFPSRVGDALPHYEFAGTTAEELTAAYRSLSRAPEPSRDSRYWGTMADADVLFFVFETGPAESLRLERDLSDLPNMRRLRGRAFVATEHYSTAPLTNHTWLSIFASWYPSPRNFSRTFSDGRTLPGVISRAAEAGYETGLYSRVDPDRIVPGDTGRLRALGFRDVKAPAHEGPPASFEDEITREELAVGLLRRDIAAWASSGRRFAATFFPIIGHAPWPDITHGRARTVAERGRALIALQDRWLGELMQELERHNRLDRTVIVVTADHGLRTRKEDPDFRLGLIDDITFHVPLLIFAPQALTSAVTVPWVTSHVDIAPTVLDLLGLERDRNAEQGGAIWNPALARRVTFQSARLYLGSDGMARDGRFLMYGYLTDRVFEAPRMRFSANDELPRDSTTASQAIDLLQRFQALQAEWTIVRPGMRERRGGSVQKIVPIERAAQSMTRAGRTPR